MSLPENVHRLRITDGHSIEEIAEATKVPPPVIAAIENGRCHVPPKVLKALAAHFGVTVTELVR